MTRKRKDLDIGEKKDKKKADIVPFKKKGGFSSGESGNPDGKPVGTQSGATRITNEIKESLIQTFRSSEAPAMLRSLLDGKIPEQFVPAELKRKIRNGEPISEEEDAVMVRVVFNSWKWAMDWMAKMFPKTLGVYGSVRLDHTLSGMVKQASTEPKSKGVIDMVEKKIEKGVTEFSVSEEGEEEDE